jgi:hypothetical protein
MDPKRVTNQLTELKMVKVEGIILVLIKECLTGRGLFHLQTSKDDKKINNQYLQKSEVLEITHTVFIEVQAA